MQTRERISRQPPHVLEVGSGPSTAPAKTAHEPGVGTGNWTRRGASHPDYKKEFNRIKDLDHEEAVLFRDGEVHPVTGSNANVTIPNHLLQDADLLIHNHPPADASHILAAGLSPMDVEVAMQWNIRDIRAIERRLDGTYSVYSIKSPEGGWTAQDLKDFQENIGGHEEMLTATMHQHLSYLPTDKANLGFHRISDVWYTKVYEGYGRDHPRLKMTVEEFNGD